MTQDIATAFLSELAASANRGDYKAHMDLISRHIAVHGLAGFDVISSKYCRREA